MTIEELVQLERDTLAGKTKLSAAAAASKSAQEDQDCPACEKTLRAKLAKQAAMKKLITGQA